jgi:hypothetical protein
MHPPIYEHRSNGSTPTHSATTTTTPPVAAIDGVRAAAPRARIGSKPLAVQTLDMHRQNRQQKMEPYGAPWLQPVAIGSNLGSTTAGATDHLRVTLTLPSGAGNTFQNQSSTITYTFTGTQRTATNK